MPTRDGPDEFQRRSGKIGTAFAKWCEMTLESIGFALLGKKHFRDAGVEIDQVAKNMNGEVVYLEFKGSSKPPRPGLRRTDTVKKALCNAFLLDRLGVGPYIIITSHKPKSATSAAKMLELAGDVVFDVICINDDDDFDRLQQYVHVLPWRSRIVAKRQAPRPVADEGPAQEYLFDIRSLAASPPLKTKQERPRRKASSANE